MLPLIGETLLEIALVLTLIQALSFFVNANLARPAAVLGFIAIITSFAILLYSFAISDFSLKVVFENSHTLKPLIYKISGTWGNHEGSLLLLLSIISLFNLAYAIWGKDVLVLHIHAGVIFLLLLFTVFASNPFLTNNFPAFEGMGLNPVLQDIGLAMHPPVLYVGYIGFSIIYAICLAALVRGKFAKELAAEAKIFCLLAWSFLTLGIMFGSWWAYRELGWGGFWFWDPVENCSLMPWLTGTALLHTLLIAERKEALKKWAALLGIITFCLSILGFFLVRSGVLTSVHSFASDPERGIFILAILSILAGAGFLLFGARAHKFKSKAGFKTISREAFILWNNLLLVVLAVIVVLGTLYPVLLEAFGGETISVGPPYYAKTFNPILGGLVLLAIITTIKWNNSAPMVIAHIGFFVVIVGICGASYFAKEKETAAKIGDKISLGAYSAELKNVYEGAERNYVFRRAEFLISNNDSEMGRLYPESRYYPVESQKTTEAALLHSFFDDIYIVIGDRASDGKYAVRFYEKPLINLIWLGSFIIFCGGIFSLVIKINTRKSK